jgi:hypothetical protein
VRPEGDPNTRACELYAMGGPQLWRSDGKVQINPENQAQANCTNCTWIEVCLPDGTSCKRLGI